VYKSDEFVLFERYYFHFYRSGVDRFLGLLGCYALSTRLQTFCSSQTSAGIHHSTQRNIPEDLNLVLFICGIFYDAVIVAHCKRSNSRMIFSYPKIGFNVVLSTPRLPRGWSCKRFCVACSIRDTSSSPQASFKYAIFMSLYFKYFSQDFAACSLYVAFAGMPHIILISSDMESKP